MGMPEFVRSILASVLANAITFFAGILGALMLAIFTALTNGLQPWQQTGIIALSSALVIWCVVATYHATKKQPSPTSPALPADVQHTTTVAKSSYTLQLAEKVGALEVLATDAEELKRKFED